MVDQIQLNKNGKNYQVDVQLITLEDNLSHPYFSLVDMAKDNLNPMGSVRIEMPYTPHISDYWIKYHGAVVISFNMADYQYQNTNSEEYIKKFELDKRLINTSYNYSFIGKVSRFKQKGKKFVIYLEDLGWKFMQKVPKEFRASFIAGQALDDAFQAMCEFLGVQFAYSIEDLHEYNFGADGYSVEKGGQVIEDTTTVLSEWGAPEEEEEEEGEEGEETDPLDSKQYENQSLINFRNKKKQKQNKNKKTKTQTSSQKNQNNSSIASDATNTDENNPNGTEVEDTDSIEDKIEKYQEEFEKKFLDLFKGNTYYESDLTSNVMNYDSITITPKAAESDASSSMSTTAGGTANGSSTGNTDGSSGSYTSPLLQDTNSAVGLQGVKIINTSGNILGSRVGASGRSTLTR